jgi:hypothetical protein
MCAIPRTRRCRAGESRAVDDPYGAASPAKRPPSAPASAPPLAGLRCALDRGGQNIELHVTFTGPVDMRDPEATERAIRRGVELAGRKLVRTLDGLDEVVGG